MLDDLAFRATGAPQVAVNLENSLAAGGSVQSVHVLRDERKPFVREAFRFQFGQCEMAGIRLNRRQIGPPLIVKFPHEVRIAAKGERSGDVLNAMAFPETIRSEERRV